MHAPNTLVAELTTRRSGGRSVVTALVGVVLLLLAGGIREAAAQDHVGQYEQADIEFGARLYNANCTRCHAESGDAVDGVDLRSGQYSRAGSDFELMRLIRTGVQGTAMPPNDFSQAELTGVIAYLRTMRDVDLSSVRLGDVTRGGGLFRAKGACSTCHRVNGDGPRTAPDLSDIGGIRTAATLQRTLLDPTGAMLPVNRSVRAVTSDGTVITGRRLNEDTYTVQLIDEQERLRSLVKADLREYTVLTTSPMPPATDVLDEQELADVLAFLLSLKGL
jgi:putative heme-binding domain-containing protein